MFFRIIFTLELQVKWYLRKSAFFRFCLSHRHLLKWFPSNFQSTYNIMYVCIYKGGGVIISIANNVSLIHYEKQIKQPQNWSWRYPKQNFELIFILWGILIKISFKGALTLVLVYWNLEYRFNCMDDFY